MKPSNLSPLGDRFVLRRRLGGGGMGVVYEAYDREREEMVALKTLSHASPASIYLLKREFRALADVAHPNLVSLYELLGVDDHWFITMELIDGVDFLTYVRGGVHDRPTSQDPSGFGGDTGEYHEPTTLIDATAEADGVESVRSEDIASSQESVAGEDFAAEGDDDGDEDDDDFYEDLDAPESIERGDVLASVEEDFPERLKTRRGKAPRGALNTAPADAPAIDAARLRMVLGGLVTGLMALHRAGKLHRDIKPSNVLVTPEGRVVVLDFGVVADLDEHRDDPRTHSFAGTPVYMSPEHMSGAPPGAASDWYSVGVMLYEALTGRPPFEDTHLGWLELLNIKQRADPVPPQRFGAQVDPELAALSMALLQRDPAQRPTGDEILRRLGAPVHAEPQADLGPLGVPLLVGRTAQLGTLEEAYQSMRTGQSITVHVHGASGLGKTALVRHFLAHLRRDPHTLILAGRCYERESVPFKALDSLIDALSRFLRHLPRSIVQAVIPQEAVALARIFPVLERVQLISEASRDDANSPDGQSLRRRAFGALRELLHRIAARWRLVLHIDDLQWSDNDSAAMLAELMRPPEPPPLLLIISYRDPEAASRSAMTEMPLLDGVEMRNLALEPLTRGEARELALALLEQENLEEARSKLLAEAIAWESAGSPFFVHEMVRYTRERNDAGGYPPPGAEEVIRLEDVLRARVARLSERARRLLEIVVVAGRPIRQLIAKRAAGITAEDHEALPELRSAHLVRTRGLSDEIEVFHHRIQEFVHAELSAEALCDRHRRLALAFKSTGRPDLEVLAEHFYGAGDLRRACRYAVAAAVHATRTLAFDRAVKLYRRALDLRITKEIETMTLRTELAEALANAGRGGEAGAMYLSVAADTADKERALDYRRRAAEHFLHAGRIEEGLALLRSVLAAVGMKLAQTPRRALWSLLLYRMLLRLRGLGFRAREPSQIPSTALLRADLAWSASVGLALVDAMHGAQFQTRGLLLALRAGEPYRVARALALEVAYVCTRGRPAWRRTEALLGAADAVAQKINHPHVLALVIGTRGLAHHFVGEWRRAFELCDRAEGMFRRKCTGVAWEVATMQLFENISLWHLGETAELSRRVPMHLQDARERGDLYSAICLRTGYTNIIWLVADDPSTAEEQVDEAMEHWGDSPGPVYLQHLYEMLARGHIGIYRGDPRGALRAINDAWPRMEESLIFYMQNPRVDSLWLRARAQVAVSVEVGTSPEERQELLQGAEQDCRRIERERLPWGNAMALLLRACIAAARGDQPGALASLDGAIPALESVDMALLVATARYRRGQLVGGEEGRAHMASVEEKLRAQWVRCPERMLMMLAPGFTNLRR